MAYGIHMGDRRGGGVYCPIVGFNPSGGGGGGGEHIRPQKLGLKG